MRRLTPSSCMQFVGPYLFAVCKTPAKTPAKQVVAAGTKQGATKAGQHIKLTAPQVHMRLVSIRHVWALIFPCVTHGTTLVFDRAFRAPSSLFAHASQSSGGSRSLFAAQRSAEGPPAVFHYAWDGGRGEEDPRGEGKEGAGVHKSKVLGPVGPTERSLHASSFIREDGTLDEAVGWWQASPRLLASTFI